MIQKMLVVGPLQCNCMLLVCERTREALLIDPGDEAQKILKMVRDEKAQVKYILHTHAHFDHVAGTSGVRGTLKATTCLHKEDLQLYENLPMQGKFFGMQLGAAPQIEKFLEDEEVITFGDYRLQVIHTPGHSPGSVSFRLLGGDEKLYSGDTLFFRSIGRSDLWGGNSETLIQSIKKRLLVLEGDTAVFPGHGPSTVVGEEKRGNPFLV